MHERKNGGLTKLLGLEILNSYGIEFEAIFHHADVELLRMYTRQPGKIPLVELQKLASPQNNVLLLRDPHTPGIGYTLRRIHAELQFYLGNKATILYEGMLDLIEEGYSQIDWSAPSLANQMDDYTRSIRSAYSYLEGFFEPRALRSYSQRRLEEIAQEETLLSPSQHEIQTRLILGFMQRGFRQTIDRSNYRLGTSVFRGG